MKDIVWRLLRCNISAAQLWGYAIANFAGLLIVISSLQFYRDITSAAAGEDDRLIPDDYLIISKKVEGLGSLISGDSGATEFSQAEIGELRSQPWARKVGTFQSADFNVYAGIDMGGRSMSTALFLESVPSEFFDINLPSWHFDPMTDTTVPIIISKDYLTLYNFGFAPSRGMPQVSEAMIGMVPLKLSVAGRGKQMNFNGRIVGFSSRLNTIAVPDEFLTWANETFSENPGTVQPSRLIIKTDSPGNPEAAKFLEEKGYEIAGDKAGSGRAAYVMRIVTTVVVSIGAVITILALAILLLSISLLLQKNRDKISTLLTLGYSPRRVGAYYVKIVATVNLAVLIAAVGAMLFARSLWLPTVKSIGVPGSSPVVAIVAALVIIAVITLLNTLYIFRSTRRLFR